MRAILQAVPEIYILMILFSNVWFAVFLGIFLLSGYNDILLNSLYPSIDSIMWASKPKRPKRKHSREREKTKQNKTCSKWAPSCLCFYRP